MPNVDERGNKITAKKEKKSIVSGRIRERRIAKVKLFARDNTAEKPNPKFCAKCGFRKRGRNHPCKNEGIK